MRKGYALHILFLWPRREVDIRTKNASEYIGDAEKDMRKHVLFACNKKIKKE